MGAITGFLDWLMGVDVEGAKAGGERALARAAAGQDDDDEGGLENTVNPMSGATMLEGGVFDADGEVWGSYDYDD